MRVDLSLAVVRLFSFALWAAFGGSDGLFLCYGVKIRVFGIKPDLGQLGGGILDDDIRKKVLREELKKRNHGKTLIEVKYVPRYPDSVEREYLKMVNNYMAIEKQIILKYIPELKQIINEGTVRLNSDAKKDNERKRKNARLGKMTVFVKLEEFFQKISMELNSAFGFFDLHIGLDKIASLEEKLSIKEWKKVIGRTLGINLLEDYYSGDASRTGYCRL